MIGFAVLLNACDKSSNPSSTTPNTGTGSGSTSTPVAPPVISQVSPLTGPVATVVTITGTGFSDTTANDTVYINGMMAAISNATTTQLVVAVPSLAGSGPVSVHVHRDSVVGPTFIYDYRYVVTTFAGSGAQGNADGTGTAAGFNYPVGIAADGSEGDIDGIGSAAAFEFPYGITVDKSGKIYVTDQGNDKVRKIVIQ